MARQAKGKAPKRVPSPATGPVRLATCAAMDASALPLVHQANLLLHVLAGTLAMGFGFWILRLPKGDARHRRLGRWFALATLAVCLFAALGLIAFRFMPLFAVLTVLVSYLALSGWRNARTQAQGPQALDAVLTALAAGLVLGLAVGGVFGDPVAKASLGAVALILVYDTLRWAFPRHWHARLWRYEHLYRMVSASFAMVSALVGNVVRVGQPWSQLLPSVLGLVVIAFEARRVWRAERGRNPG